MASDPPLPGRPNLHVALAMTIPEADPSWSDAELIKAVDRYVRLASTPRDGLFSLLDEEAS